MRKSVLLSVFLLAGCQTLSAGVERDSLGNVYPPACHGNVVVDGYYHTLNGVKGYVQIVPREQMPRIPGTQNARYSEAMSSGGKTGISSIFVASDDTDRYDSIKHALCHAIAGSWHQTGGLAERANGGRLN